MSEIFWYQVLAFEAGLCLVPVVALIVFAILKVLR